MTDQQWSGCGWVRAHTSVIYDQFPAPWTTPKWESRWKSRNWRASERLSPRWVTQYIWQRTKPGIPHLITKRPDHPLNQRFTNSDLLATGGCSHSSTYGRQKSGPFEGAVWSHTLSRAMRMVWAMKKRSIWVVWEPRKRTAASVVKSNKKAKEGKGEEKNK